MLLKQKAFTPGKRHQIATVRTDLYRGKPIKSLLYPGINKRQGRNASGRITVKHRGGGVKRRLRKIDFQRKKFDLPARVERIEYDPMRSSHLALLFYQDGSKSYILAPEGLKKGDQVISGKKVEAKIGNALPLRNIPIGLPIHNIELKIGKGGQIVRGAGTSALVQSKEDKYAVVQLPSKEQRLINLECFATIGQLSNPTWKNRQLGKAGRKRLLGIRPTVRGTAQHPGSHPHGGGEGRSGVGLKYPKTATGRVVAPGKKTRKVRKSKRWLIKDRRVK